MTTTLTARSPEDLLAVVPFVLGFEPADSIVMLTLGAAHAFHARVDLPDDPRDVAEVLAVLLEPAVRHGAEAAVFLLYTGDDALAREVVARLEQRGRAAPRLVEALRVDGGRWFSLRGCPPGAAGGVPYDLSGHAFVAGAVLEGRVLHRSRAALAATLRPDPVAVAEVEAARTGRPGSAAWVEQLLDRRVGRDDPLPAREAARLLEAIADPSVRDVAWGRVRRGSARDDVRLWEALVRCAPEELVPHAAAVLAFAAWIAGDGALAWCAVDRAREADPGHSLAALVADVLTAAISPAQWEDACRRQRSVP
ncbi:DUF4192 domain-containing protein [Nocardioides euryhalodurans]|nr:DUF4192 domain-containing protein [Nocardioides euryhalodurans]